MVIQCNGYHFLENRNTLPFGCQEHALRIVNLLPEVSNWAFTNFRWADILVTDLTDHLFFRSANHIHSGRVGINDHMRFRINKNNTCLGKVNYGLLTTL